MLASFCFLQSSLFLSSHKFLKRPTRLVARMLKKWRRRRRQSECKLFSLDCFVRRRSWLCCYWWVIRHMLAIPWLLNDYEAKKNAFLYLALPIQSNPKWMHWMGLPLLFGQSCWLSPENVFASLLRTQIWENKNFVHAFNDHDDDCGGWWWWYWDEIARSTKFVSIVVPSKRINSMNINLNPTSWVSNRPDTQSDVWVANQTRPTDGLSCLISEHFAKRSLAK